MFAEYNLRVRGEFTFVRSTHLDQHSLLSGNVGQKRDLKSQF